MDKERPVVDSNPNEPDGPFAPSPGQRERPGQAQFAPDPGSTADSEPDQWTDPSEAREERARVDDPVGSARDDHRKPS